MKVATWLFWRAVYLFDFRRPAIEYWWLVKSERLRSPWWKFRPNVFHNEPGKMHEVRLDNESSYTEARRTITVDVHVGHGSGRIVGFDIWDEDLTNA